MIFAEYSESYTRYLSNSLGSGEDPGFMTMHEFGPWDTTKASDMRMAGNLLYAIALRAEKA